MQQVGLPIARQWDRYLVQQNVLLVQAIFKEFHSLSVDNMAKQESPANAKGTRDSSACMKAHCEQM